MNRATAPQVIAESGLEPGDLAIAPLDPAPALSVGSAAPLRAHRACARQCNLDSSWGKSNPDRELSLGGGMGTKEDNLRIGSEADLEISVGMRTKIKAHVFLRRARVNEIGFEIVNTDLESRYRLRRLLVETMDRTPQTKTRSGAASASFSGPIWTKIKSLRKRRLLP